jgi:mRNA interferase MazF
VSNDENNKHSGIIEVVYSTTQPKTELPTHVTIRSTGRVSTVLCEQVTSVSVERVNNYIGQVSEQEMKNIDIALMISLQLDGDSKSHKQYNETIKKQQEEIGSLKREIETLQQECDDRIAEIEQDAAVYVEENRKVDASRQSEDIIKVQTERDTFKALYEQLFERLLTMGGTGN